MNKRKSAPSTEKVEQDSKKFKKEEFFDVVKKRKGKTFKFKEM